MRAPIAFTYGNCVFADGLTDAWAAFAIEASSYEWLGEDAKRARFVALLGALEAVQADLQILRVAARPDASRYADELQAASVHGSAHARARERYVSEHARRLAELGSARSPVFMLVSLREPERDVATYVSRIAERGLGEWRQSLSRCLRCTTGAH